MEHKAHIIFTMKIQEIKPEGRRLIGNFHVRACGHRQMSSKFVVRGAMIAAAYVVLTFTFEPISFEEIQLRVAEALTILPVFTLAAVPGLAIGCLLANTLCGAPLPDVLFGSLATLIGAAGTRKLRNRGPALAVMPPIAANMLMIPFVLRYAYEVPLPIPLMMATVGLGEAVSCGILGLLLHRALYAHRKSIFGADEQDTASQKNDRRESA